MKTEKTVIELLESADFAYASKSEALLVAAYAERTNYTADLIIAAVKTIKAVFSGLKMSRMSVSQAA